ncbi:hypothetical protein HHO41_09240 [Bacillus sp. DNRA2]|uniref:hypothetical protein n=1 Tax=Bacillus sp. DNRA2 TaxID=2723053 RepID=UPI00145E0DFF|nr:hypothetical protein [Bacillus sp. DNRA2]NMD70475.1 hypothetical protein [Bacillus sp. DNRA2]
MPKKPHGKDMVNQELLKKLVEINSNLNQLASTQESLIAFVDDFDEIVNNIIRENLASSYFQAILQNILNPNDSDFGEIAKEYMNMEIKLITTGGTLQGQILSVEEDFLIFQETLGYETLVPYRHIQGITLQGSV